MTIPALHRTASLNQAIDRTTVKVRILDMEKKEKAQATKDKALEKPQATTEETNSHLVAIKARTGMMKLHLHATEARPVRITVRANMAIKVENLLSQRTEDRSRRLHQDTAAKILVPDTSKKM